MQNKHEFRGIMVMRPDGKRASDSIFSSKTIAALSAESAASGESDGPHWFDLEELGWSMVPVAVTAEVFNS